MAMGLYSNPEFLRQVWQPRTIMEAWQLKQKFTDQAIFVSGGTLLRTQWESGTVPKPLHLISLESLPELRGIHSDNQETRLGSAVTLAACLRDLRTPTLLKQACRNIAAPSIRNIGTLGGNIMSTVGDSIPALLAVDARLVWFNGTNTIIQTTEDWLQQRRSEPSMKELRLLLEIIVPKLEETNYLMAPFYEKLGRREAFCPSVVTIAGELHMDTEDKIRSVRLAAGSAAAMAIRLTDTEASLEGQQLSLGLIKHIHPLIIKQFDGGTDAFASNEYRKQAAANMIAAALWSRISSKNR
ncbi:molybdopterin dehydrogenase [Paenibacillus sp. LMG 31456]|uniref:Molybdopterin dehydrogenase n=1 Tax=Paenibacillus foliorum TaxID=2654974 RepID=A0A972GX77_9BACL|nr:FAD binding domain-containing protein [Paenibacillus foliorum]NOU92206.1 molybdopterin dehydrogenase [Paenibacillus foliorum]